MTTTVDQTFAEWVILELLGHRRLGGHLTEVTIAGTGFLRLDIPGGDGQPPMTQIVNPSSVYAITPTTEDIARRVATLGHSPYASTVDTYASDEHVVRRLVELCPGGCGRPTNDPNDDLCSSCLEDGDHLA